MDKYTALRNKHQTFIYHSFDIIRSSSKLCFGFHFSLDDIHFRPTWSYEGESFDDEIDSALLEYAVFNLGMIELLSYWKCACPKNVYVNCGSLDDFQIKWWTKLYRKGLSEFFYRNGISPDDDFVKITAENPKSPKFSSVNTGSGVLIPVGGGKDSIVTMELLRGGMKDNKCYIINPRKPVVATAMAAGYAEDDIIGVRRAIDSKLLELNSQGYLNGHTPFSAVIAFSSFIFATLNGKKYIALSNESSANECNVEGTEINHQYSKSTEFEADFRDYTDRYFGKYPEYFSLLRPLSEWQITKKFCEYPKYLNIFQSCNVGSKTDTWCGKCAKCLYVYIMLAAFLPDEKLISVFGRNMLDAPEFADMLDALIYPSIDKPFECVGTRDEICLALNRALERRAENPPYLLKSFTADELISADLDKFYDKNNFLPEEFICLIG